MMDYDSSIGDIINSINPTNYVISGATPM